MAACGERVEQSFDMDRASADLISMGILKNICGQHSMRQMEENFNEQTCIDTLRILSGNRRLQEMSHYDTLNVYYYIKNVPK